MISLLSSSRNPSLVLVLLSTLFNQWGITEGFSTVSLNSCPPSSLDTTTEQRSTASIVLYASDITDRDVDTVDEGRIASRRSFFTATVGCAVAGTAGIIAGVPRSNDVKKIILTSPEAKDIATSPVKLDSVEDVIALLEQRCDRKFLHSVVASDYHFLYRGMASNSPSSTMRSTIVEGEGSDLLLPETYGEEAAVTFFRKLDDAMASRPVRPGSNAHLATTAILDAAEWGSPVSIWPLSTEDQDGYAHFAWYEDGGKFWPRPKAWEEHATAIDEGIIVDGVNCGSANLEDALRTKSAEILFRADSYLAIPSRLDDRVREGLRKAFIL